MSINVVANSDFSQYSGFFPTEESIITGYLAAAQRVVEDYLGYPLVRSKHFYYKRQLFDSTGILLDNLPVRSIGEFTINGCAPECWDGSFREWGLEYPVRYNDMVYVEYFAGYGTQTATGWDFSDLDPIIRMTILRIASLIHQESQGNIGTTGANLGGVSRTFTNYTNYDKFLKPLNSLRVYPL